MKKSQKIYLPIKRLIGLFGSFLGILVCAVFLWWWVIPINCISTKGHPFFVHKRLGKNKKVFNLLKFRSMRLDVDPNIPPATITEETQKSFETKFGSFLRKSSIDETLQLFNIFIGQMAFIGPRPGAAMNEDDLVVAREKFVPNAFAVKPGLSGYAQLKMNREHGQEEKAFNDHYYVQNLSFWFDCKIFFLTIFKIFGSSKGK